MSDKNPDALVFRTEVRVTIRGTQEALKSLIKWLLNETKIRPTKWEGSDLGELEWHFRSDDWDVIANKLQEFGFVPQGQMVGIVAKEALQLRHQLEKQFQRLPENLQKNFDINTIKNIFFRNHPNKVISIILLDDSKIRFYNKFGIWRQEE